MERRLTREVSVGNVIIGGDHPIVIQSMTATKTRDIDGTVRLVNHLRSRGAGVIRIAADSKEDAKALGEIRIQTIGANLSVDLQENWDTLVGLVAPYVDKIRYNPGHLYHHQRGRSARDMVSSIVDVAREYDCALRVGVNCGSVDPELAARFEADSVTAMVESALMHCRTLEDLYFTRYVVSLKDSNVAKVIEANRRFAALMPDVPLHLGLTEAGMPPKGVLKTRQALGELLSEGTGETLRVSLTLSNERKHEEVEAGSRLVQDVREGLWTPTVDKDPNIVDLVACPSCNRVENSAFVEVIEWIGEATKGMHFDEPVKVAGMGCRVNGPGEAKDARVALWCGPKSVNFTIDGKPAGSLPFEKEAIVAQVLEELNKLLQK